MIIMVQEEEQEDEEEQNNKKKRRRSKKESSSQVKNRFQKLHITLERNPHHPPKKKTNKPQIVVVRQNMDRFFGRKKKTHTKKKRLDSPLGLVAHSSPRESAMSVSQSFSDPDSSLLLFVSTAICGMLTVH